MPNVSEYPHGAPNWFELGTTDQAEAKTFYCSLFDWTVNDMPMGPGEFYSMFQLRGRDTGAAYTLPPKLREQGVPPHWGVYFAVENVDESAAKVTQLGGSLIQPPFDVMDVGRMAIARDPGGAVFSLWQRKLHFGAGVVNELNTVLWCELATRDPEKVLAFYDGLFGWQTRSEPNMPGYTQFCAGGQWRGGVMDVRGHPPFEGVPSNWGIYLCVADCDATAGKAKSLGGAVLAPPFDLPRVGRIAALADPQGAHFSVITPNPNA